MRIRIKFRKYGVMRFIGHLDIMRYFQKAMRRANIDIAYSEGFSPHQIMSFAAPLGVGITSDGEYLDIEAKSTKSTQESIAALNAVMVDGIEITQYVALRQDEKKAMTAVGAADYIVYFKNEIDFTQEELEEKIRIYYEAVSYTHLDVYKRQRLYTACFRRTTVNFRKGRIKGTSSSIKSGRSNITAVSYTHLG